MVKLVPNYAIVKLETEFKFGIKRGLVQKNELGSTYFFFFETNHLLVIQA